MTAFFVVTNHVMSKLNHFAPIQRFTSWNCKWSQGDFPPTLIHSIDDGFYMIKKNNSYIVLLREFVEETATIIERNHRRI